MFNREKFLHMREATASNFLREFWNSIDLGLI
jgi:hypothetical protein